MCLAVLHWNPTHSTPLKIVANRDEFRARATEPLHFWKGADFYAGKDLEAGGSWLGVSANYNIALLTNIRPGYVGKKGELSRGNLVTEFLTDGHSPQSFRQKIQKDIHRYGGFNLIIGNTQELIWFSSDHPEGELITPGIHALSNDALNTNWPKVTLATEQMSEQSNSLEKDLTKHSILASQTEANDATLPQTGVPIEWEKRLSAQTITGAEYGTLSRTHILLSENKCEMAEQQINQQGDVTSTKVFRW
jgi:uncharacterized protein with NRDE domain